MAADLQQTSFYGAGRRESLRGPQGPEGPQGPQGKEGPAGPALPLSNYATNTDALAAGLAPGTLYASPAGFVMVVLQD